MSRNCNECGAVRDGAGACPECGHEPAGTAEGGATDDEAVRVESFVWACPECDREHVKNSPPCSRCGHPMLERRERTAAEDVDVPSSSYLSAVRPYAPVILLFAVVIGLTATGTVTLGMLPWHGPPPLPDAPGEADDAAGLDLEAVERAVHDRFEAERERRAVASRSYDADLAHLAAYLNRDRVRVDHGRSSVGDPDPEDYDFPCSGAIEVQPFELPGEEGAAAYDDEAALAEAIEDLVRVRPEVERVLFSSGSAEALDVHVGPDGDVYVYYAAC